MRVVKNSHTMISPSVPEIISSIKPVDYLLVQADKPWYSYYINFILFPDGPVNVSLVPPDLHYSVIEGHSLPSISCSSLCYPSCLQEWKNAVSNEELGHEGNLSFGILYRSDAGEYECTSSNQAMEYNNSVSVSIQVSVNCK